jgi:hypothetical protein
MAPSVPVPRGGLTLLAALTDSERRTVPFHVLAGKAGMCTTTLRYYAASGVTKTVLNRRKKLHDLAMVVGIPLRGDPARPYLLYSEQGLAPPLLDDEWRKTRFALAWEDFGRRVVAELALTGPLAHLPAAQRASLVRASGIWQNAIVGPDTTVPVCNGTPTCTCYIKHLRVCVASQRYAHEGPHLTQDEFAELIDRFCRPEYAAASVVPELEAAGASGGADRKQVNDIAAHLRQITDVLGVKPGSGAEAMIYLDAGLLPPVGPFGVAPARVSLVQPDTTFTPPATHPWRYLPVYAYVHGLSEPSPERVRQTAAIRAYFLSQTQP